MIGLAVYIGTVERRPMTATKIAAFVGMPRPTVIDRLRVLVRRGSVEKIGTTYFMTAKQVDRMTRRTNGLMVRLVRKVSDELSR